MIKIFHKAISAITIGFLAFFGICVSAEGSQDAFNVDIQNVWFKPKLTVDADPVCGKLLLATHAKFVSVDSQYSDLVGFKRISGPFETNQDSKSGVHFLVDDPRQFIFTSSNGSKLFGYFLNLGGCGGACESEELLISNERFSKGAPDKHLAASTPSAPGWSLIKNLKGALYAQGIVDGHLQLYRIVSPKNWRLSCDVSLKPDNLQEDSNPEVKTTFKAINALITATGGLSRGAGDCGSMGTPWQWKNKVKENLYETIYRPWALSVSPIDRYSENSYGDYARIEKNLKLWALGGLGEYHDLKLYQEQLAETTRTLADFYTKQFGWSPTSSLKMAQLATTNAISLSFGFYMYDPYPLRTERQLRAAILEHKPMSQIRAIKFNKFNEEMNDLSERDSVLNVAVEYPEALHYLLEKGANPNAVNAFGKTPLMYAAQANQFEATKLLLSAGADANVATTKPSDTCEYSIETSHVTALHYAARYASVPVINLLVESGAVTFIQSYSTGSRLEYPLDWLQRYVSKPTEKEMERNPNIVSTDIEKAANLLRVPNDKERERIATNMIIRAETDYAKGKPEPAYRYLQIAIAAQPSNQKALSDIPLVALKAGQIGPAVKSVNQAIEVLKTPSLQAAAWFNKGIICEQLGADTVDYDGNRCDVDQIQPYMRALKLEATPARTNKLKSFFNKNSAGVCVFSGLLSPTLTVRILSHASHQRIYILHRAGLEIAPETIQWSIHFDGHTENALLTPKLVDRLVFDGEAVTVFEGIEYGKFPTINGNVWCGK